VATFSVVIATRDRATLFGKALQSVVAQVHAPDEIVVVNDGSSEEQVEEYHKIVDAVTLPLRYYALPRYARGHGAAYARNSGASLARGDYLCFLDDDDYWTDSGYLERVKATIEAFPSRVDLHFTNQTAYIGDERVNKSIWLESLADVLNEAKRPPDAQGAYRVGVEDLVRSNGFCHLNTLVMRRELFNSAGKIDEFNSYEEDRDLYFRLIDRAQCMLYSPHYVARHNVPDTSKRSNVTTSLTDLEQRLAQLRVCNRLILFASHRSIRAYGRLHLGYALKRIAETLAAQKKFSLAFYFSAEALGAAPTFKWAGFMAFVALARLKQLLLR
jgi:glycosyltransferase involved in cell wall biosynthesis